MKSRKSTWFAVRYGRGQYYDGHLLGTDSPEEATRFTLSEARTKYRLMKDLARRLGLKERYYPHIVKVTTELTELKAV